MRGKKVMAAINNRPGLGMDFSLRGNEKADFTSRTLAA
jgi:hypothetical protein